jgi:hypothetical protein
MADIIWDTIKDMTKDKLEPDPQPAPVPAPVPDKKKVEDCVELLRNAERNGGITKIAHAQGQATATIKAIRKAMDKRLRELGVEAIPIP